MGLDTITDDERRRMREAALARAGKPITPDVMEPADPTGPQDYEPIDSPVSMAPPVPTQDEAMREEMRTANNYEAQASFGAGLGRGLSKISASIAGIRPDNSTWDRQDTEASQRRSAVSKFLQAKAIKNIEAETERKKLEADALDKMYQRKHDDAVLAESERHSRATENKPGEQLFPIQIQGQTVPVKAGLALNYDQFTTKQDQALQELAVTGMDIAPGARPTPEGAKAVRTAVTSLEAIKKTNARISALHQQYGTEFGTKAAGLMNQAVTANRIEGKNIAQLGALSASDNELMEKMTGPSPAEFLSNIKAYFGIDNTEAALGAFQQWAQDRVNAAGTANNYVPKAAAGRANRAGDVRMLNKDGNVIDVPAGEVGVPVKYKVSPDKKRRVPVFANGSTGPEEANP